MADMGGDPRKEARLIKEQGEEICVGFTGDARKESLHDITSSSRYGRETRSGVFVLQDHRALTNRTVGEAAPTSSFDPTFTLRTHHERNWPYCASNVSCFSERNTQQEELSPLPNTGASEALPGGGKTYMTGKASALDLSGVELNDRNGVYQCGNERDGKRSGISLLILRGDCLVWRQVASVGDTVEFDSLSFDHPSLRWSRDGDRIPAGNGLAKLEIAGVEASDAGIYEMYKEGERRRTRNFFGLVVRESTKGSFGADCRQTCHCVTELCDPYTGAISGGWFPGWTSQIPADRNSALGPKSAWKSEEERGSAPF